jgi:hypothetical protein
MKKFLTVCLLAGTFYTNAQKADETSSTPINTSGWIKVYSNDKIGYINKEGKEVIPAIYDEIEDSPTYYNNLLMVERDGFIGFVDSNGREIVTPQYEMVGPINNSNWLMVKKDGLFGFIDNTGHEVVAPKYTSLSVDTFSLDASKNPKCYLLDRSIINSKL